MDSFNQLLSSPRKDKVVFVMGATGTGKSKLAIDLASHFGGEIVNSDKMQVYDGLDVITNKVTEEESAGVAHHLIGGVHPDADFTALDFRTEATRAIECILGRGLLPVVAGGSNSYIEALVDDEDGEFRSRFECCFLWVDVELTALHAHVGERVDRMVEKGLVQEARGVFLPDADYTKGVRRAIGVPEMDKYLREEAAEPPTTDEEEREMMLAAAIDEVKANTCKLTCCQLEKIHRLRTECGWDIHRLDATGVIEKKGTDESEDEWVQYVKIPAIDIVQQFLDNKELDTIPNNATKNPATVIEPSAAAAVEPAAVAAA